MTFPSKEASPVFLEKAGLSFVTIPSLASEGVKHGIFTRLGGTSPVPWASLNMGATVGDEIEHVRENRRRSFQALGLDITSQHDTWLEHGTRVVFADAPRDINETPQKADIVLTDRPEVTLFMRYADCTPILLYDPVRKVAGLAHAGWLGTVKLVARAAVEAMTGHYGCKPAEIRAVIGPAICAEHYQVGIDVVERVQQAFGGSAGQALTRTEDGRWHFDLWTANQMVLEGAGVRQVEQSGLCTACDTGHWYSHRAEHGTTGRFGALMALPS